MNIEKTVFRIVIVLFFLLFGACESGSDDMASRHSDFNFDWRFALGDEPVFSDPQFDDSAWRQLRLPHDWSIEADFD